MRLSLRHRVQSQRVFTGRDNLPLHPAHCLKLLVSHKNADTKQWPHCLIGRSLRRVMSRPCCGSTAKPSARATTVVAEPWTNIARTDEQIGLRLIIDQRVKESGEVQLAPLVDHAASKALREAKQRRSAYTLSVRAGSSRAKERTRLSCRGTL